MRCRLSLRRLPMRTSEAGDCEKTWETKSEKFPRSPKSKSDHRKQANDSSSDEDENASRRSKCKRFRGERKIRAKRAMVDHTKSNQKSIREEAKLHKGCSAVHSYSPIARAFRKFKEKDAAPFEDSDTSDDRVDFSVTRQNSLARLSTYIFEEPREKCTEEDGETVKCPYSEIVSPRKNHGECNRSSPLIVQTKGILKRTTCKKMSKAYGSKKGLSVLNQRESENKNTNQNIEDRDGEDIFSEVEEVDCMSSGYLPVKAASFVTYAAATPSHTPQRVPMPVRYDSISDSFDMGISRNFNQANLALIKSPAKTPNVEDLIINQSRHVPFCYGDQHLFSECFSARDSSSAKESEVGDKENVNFQKQSTMRYRPPSDPAGIMLTKYSSRTVSCSDDKVTEGDRDPRKPCASRSKFQDQSAAEKCLEPLDSAIINSETKNLGNEEEQQHSQKQHSSCYMVHGYTCPLLFDDKHVEEISSKNKGLSDGLQFGDHFEPLSTMPLAAKPLVSDGAGDKRVPKKILAVQTDRNCRLQFIKANKLALSRKFNKITSLINRFEVISTSDNRFDCQVTSKNKPSVHGIKPRKSQSDPTVKLEVAKSATSGTSSVPRLPSEAKYICNRKSSRRQECTDCDRVKKRGVAETPKSVTWEHVIESPGLRAPVNEPVHITWEQQLESPLLAAYEGGYSADTSLSTKDQENDSIYGDGTKGVDHIFSDQKLVLEEESDYYDLETFANFRKGTLDVACVNVRPYETKDINHSQIISGKHTFELQSPSLVNQSSFEKETQHFSKTKNHLREAHDIDYTSSNQESKSCQARKINVELHKNPVFEDRTVLKENVTQINQKFFKNSEKECDSRESSDDDTCAREKGLIQNFFDNSSITSCSSSSSGLLSGGDLNLSWLDDAVRESEEFLSEITVTAQQIRNDYMMKT